MASIIAISSVRAAGLLLVQVGKAAPQGFHRLRTRLRRQTAANLPEQGAEQFDLRAQVVVRQEFSCAFMAKESGPAQRIQCGKAGYFLIVGAHHPTARRALRNIRSHGLRDQCRPASTTAARRGTTRSGCGIRMPNGHPRW